ncbi:neurotactin [Ancylobacter novellus DSM 506]|uniref:Neurotactin n=1 Tax=Ancylobacter novellus (strain ATCC 8093 / DSM 506 / JCM 20403 / CCM 1077 / IAM 12100 / NBRC 12443 / NCIMB 10456) TaxID=639283 RepID=D6ZZT9_ANCN5|nr:hypothetical protein [Ancylobacter novellus]ADH87353.1 neurotactin [Ancylobacter novellus DSM 506]
MAVKKAGTARTVPVTVAAPQQAATIPAATSFAPSGAPEQTVPDVDPKHAAIDDNPRANTSVEQNRIDFNDPTLSGSEAVANNLKGEG